MSTQSTVELTFPPEVTDAVTKALTSTFAAMYGEEPRTVDESTICPETPHVAGLISFVGDLNWTLCWMLPQPTAEKLAAHFMGGMEVPFDSDEMADIAGELVNILAGDVVARLEQQGLKAQMSLPTVARGAGLRVLPDRGTGVQRIAFDSSLGSFWLRLACGEEARTRKPGT